LRRPQFRNKLTLLRLGGGIALSESLPERDSLPAEAPDGRSTAHRPAAVRLFRRLVIYHAVLATCLLFAAVVFPDFTRDLPIGGVKQLVEAREAATRKAERAELVVTPAQTEAVDNSTSVTTALDRLGSARQLAIVLIGTWLLMLPVSWVHKGIHRTSVHDHSLDETVLILPGIVAALVLIVQHSLALAFSLAGIVAGVQFRRALQDTFDALFILVAIGTGIAAGIRALEIAAVLTVFFCYSSLYVHYVGDGLESDFQARKKEEKKLRKKQAGESADDEVD
jgi:hypothetical protein